MGPKMSINNSGINAKLGGGIISITVTGEESLIKLGNFIDWEAIEAVVLPDLKKTEKGCWWRGRALMLRIHLGVYILQALYNKTDRVIGQEINNNAIFQVFCGLNIVDHWHVPHASKIEEFRNRLSVSSHHAVGELVIKAAHQAKFADPTWMDIDSTVQEANIAYPSDANMMMKLCIKASRVADILKEFGGNFSVDVKKK